MSRATDAAFDALHALMAGSMTEELERGINRARQPKLIADPDDAERQIPNPAYEPLSPKLLGVIRAFLKDNGIDAPAHSPRLNNLADQLRDMDLDEEAERTLQ